MHCVFSCPPHPSVLRGVFILSLDSFLQDPSKPAKNAVISDACSVVDVLGDDVRYLSTRHKCRIRTNFVFNHRNHLIERYCAIELKEYRRIFRATDEVFVHPLL